MSDPWFRFFPSDWLSGVAGLSAAERGVYVTLLAIIYDHGGPVARDDARLARQCGIPTPGFTRALDALISLGKITLENGMIFNERAKNELHEREIRKLGAKEAASSRWEKHKQNQSTDDAAALPQQCEPNATRARVPQPQPEYISPSEISNEISSGSSPAAPGDASPQPVLFDLRKARERKVESDLDLLDKVTDLWNAWARRYGSPTVERLTERRAVHCRRRIADLRAYGHDSPEAAFEFLLQKCSASFYARGSPRKPLEFDQLMREDFMTRMLEGAFEYREAKRV